MSRWTDSAKTTLEQYFTNLRGSLAASGVDADEVDQRAHRQAGAFLQPGFPGWGRDHAVCRAARGLGRLARGFDLRLVGNEPRIDSGYRRFWVWARPSR